MLFVVHLLSIMMFVDSQEKNMDNPMHTRDYDSIHSWMTAPHAVISYLREKVVTSLSIYDHVQVPIFRQWCNSSDSLPFSYLQAAPNPLTSEHPMFGLNFCSDWRLSSSLLNASPTIWPKVCGHFSKLLSSAVSSEEFCLCCSTQGYFGQWCTSNLVA